VCSARRPGSSPAASTTSCFIRVNVHLDDTESWLVRDDGTVPLRIMVQDTAVFDDTGEPRRRSKAL
jgi:hypothetical protein